MNDDDEEYETKQTLHQKEVVTSQMIGILQSRLTSLNTLAHSRQVALGYDLTSDSDYCSMKASRSTYESLLNVSNKSKSSSSNSAAAASRLLQMEKLFGPDEKLKPRAQMIKKNRPENKKNMRAVLEKQLQSDLEDYITRSADSFEYTSANASQLRMNSKLLLSYAFERMHIVQGKQLLKKFALGDMSCRQFYSIFWFIFCRFFQKNSEMHQDVLVNSICSIYIKMLASLKSNKDFFFATYPYIVASGVCWGFHYLFPGSRHLYTSSVKSKIYILVCELLFGLKMCPITVQMQRKKYFPDEFIDYTTINGSSDHHSTEKTTAIFSNNLQRKGSCNELLFSLDKVGNQRPKSDESPKLRSNLSLDRLPTIDGFYDDFSTPGNIRPRQSRGCFNSTEMSPLAQKFFPTRNPSIKNPSFLKRTSPSSNCYVGGENTYKKSLHRHSSLENLAIETSKKNAKCKREFKKNQRILGLEMKKIERNRDRILSGSPASIHNYCLSLANKKLLDDGTM